VSALPKLPAGVVLRVRCPECGRDTAVTKRGTIDRHDDARDHYSLSRRCDGVASAVAQEVLRASVEEARARAVRWASHCRAEVAKATEGANAADAEARALEAVAAKLAEVTP
jgi:hypothetical protein